MGLIAAMVTAIVLARGRRWRGDRRDRWRSSRRASSTSAFSIPAWPSDTRPQTGATGARTSGRSAGGWSRRHPVRGVGAGNFRDVVGPLRAHRAGRDHGQRPDHRRAPLRPQRLPGDAGGAGDRGIGPVRRPGRRGDRHGRTGGPQVRARRRREHGAPEPAPWSWRWSRSWRWTSSSPTSSASSCGCSWRSVPPCSRLRPSEPVPAASEERRPGAALAGARAPLLTRQAPQELGHPAHLGARPSWRDVLRVRPRSAACRSPGSEAIASSSRGGAGIARGDEPRGLADRLADPARRRSRPPAPRRRTPRSGPVAGPRSTRCEAARGSSDRAR